MWTSALRAYLISDGTIMPSIADFSQRRRADARWRSRPSQPRPRTVNGAEPMRARSRVGTVAYHRRSRAHDVRRNRPEGNGVGDGFLDHVVGKEYIGVTSPDRSTPSDCDCFPGDH